MRRISPILVVLLTVVACGPSAEEQAAEAAAAAAAAEDSLLATAEAAFDESVFDTLTWESPEAQLARGEQVYNFSCSRCHGTRGLGDAEFVRGGDTLRPVSFLDSTWHLAGNVEGIRRAIFVGTTEQMPHWGLEGLSAEAVDAAAVYIIEGLPAR
jgi:mono/diheme cytochrome c family protein